MRKIKKIKRIGAILLIFLFNINAFATAVSDNDGSAFITKAEFDALKSSFQAQIDTYNQGIDGKIDAAIAAYLGGITFQTKKEVEGYLPSISKLGIDQEYIKFAYGGAMSINTGNPRVSTIVNPNICIIGIYNYPKPSWQAIHFLSHQPGTWGGQYDNVNAGVYLAGFASHTEAGTTYLALSDDYKINKWQMVLAVQASDEHMTNAINTSTTVGSTGLTWDFSAFELPSADSFTFAANNKTFTCARSQANVIKDTKTLDIKNRAGNYYRSSGDAPIFGWLTKDFYVYYKNSTSDYVKSETSPIACYRRYVYSQGDSSWNISTEKFTYKFRMPYTYTTYFDELINLGSTTSFGEHVYCYEGLPLVTCDNTAKKVSIPINVVNCGTTNATKYKAVICDEKFDNVEATSTSKHIVFQDTTWQSFGDRTINIDFSDKKERTLWIKLVPYEDNQNIVLKINLQSTKNIIIELEK